MVLRGQLRGRVGRRRLLKSRSFERLFLYLKLLLLKRSGRAAQCGNNHTAWVPTPVASIYSVRLTLLALTLISALYKSHAIYIFIHLHFGAEVTPCVGPGKPRTTSSTRSPAPEYKKPRLTDQERFLDCGNPMNGFARIVMCIGIKPPQMDNYSKKLAK